MFAPVLSFGQHFVGAVTLLGAAVGGFALGNKHRKLKKKLKRAKKKLRA